jgi:exopolysaccharide transport family protein
VPAQSGFAGAVDTNASPDFDVVRLLRGLRRRLGVIAGVAAAGTALAMVAVFQITPRYTAEAKLMIDVQQQHVVDFDAVLSGLPADASTIDTQVEIIRSRAIAQSVVRKLRLQDDPEFNPSLRPKGLLDHLEPGRWLASTFPPVAAPETPEATEARAVENAVASLLAAESVTRLNVTHVIKIAATSQDPAKAALIANTIAETYILSQLEARFDATRQASEWLSERLDGLRRQLEVSERAVELYRTENGLLASSAGMTITEQQLSELNAQLILARADRAEKQAKYSRARQILSGGGNIESVVDVLQSSVIGDLRKQEAELARKQGDLSSKYGPRHPSILNLEAERRDLANQIQNEVKRIVASLSNETLVADTRVRALEESLEDLQKQTGQNNQAVIRLNELQRESSANRAVYESFLNRFKETSQQQSLQTSESRIVAAAVAPRAPSYPRTGLIAMLAVFLSSLAGIGLAFLLDRLDNGLQTSLQVEALLGLPHLASIPKISREKDTDGRPLRPEEHAVRKPLSAFSESLRGLRTALALSNVDSPPKVVLFTSALPDEGKTTTAVSFARAAALAGIKTLLLDCDLRHPSVHDALGMTRSKVGLVECLAGKATLEEAITRDSMTALDVLPVASGAANPPDLLGSAQMRHLLQQLRKTYDIVVLDSAPILPVADTHVLAAVADKTVYIVKWDATPRDAVVGAIKVLRNIQASLAGTAFAQVDTARQSKYGYGDAGYYYGRYRHYYAE